MEPVGALATETVALPETSIVEQAKPSASDFAHLRHSARKLASCFCCAMRLELLTDAISACNCCSDPKAFRLRPLPSSFLRCDPRFVAGAPGGPDVRCTHATGSSDAVSTITRRVMGNLRIAAEQSRCHA